MLLTFSRGSSHHFVPISTSSIVNILKVKVSIHSNASFLSFVFALSEFICFCLFIFKTISLG